MADSKKFRILSLDGGGIRGLYSAKMLKRIEDECGVDFYDDFDISSSERRQVRFWQDL